MTRQSFIKGTMILLAAGVVNRILGFVPRIALPRVIGAEGVGLYQMGYPLLIVMLTIITGGVPLAVAKLVAEAEAEDNVLQIRRILRLALSLTITLGGLMTILCFLSAGWMTKYLFTDDRVYYTFLAMSPMIVIVGISSVLRGYFQGLHNMIPTALSQVTETVVRIIAVLAFAFILLPYGIHIAAAGAMIGVTLGEIGGLLVLLIQWRNQKGWAKPSTVRPTNAATFTAGTMVAPTLFGKFLSVAVPVTGSRLVGSGSYFLESILTVQSLAAAGVATAVATAQYGALQGMIIPILLLPTALTYSLAVSLIPSLSEAAQQKDIRTIHKRLHQSVKLALITGAPFAVGMYLFAVPFCRFVYADSTVGSMLKLMAPIALFIYAQGPLQAALQALDRPGAALRNTFVGACLKLTLIALLASRPEFGIIGVIIAINVNTAVVTVLHAITVGKLLKFSMPLSDFIKIATAMFAMGFACYIAWQQPINLAEPMKLLIAFSFGMVIYLTSCVVLRLIDRHDAARLFWLGKKFVK